MNQARDTADLNEIDGLWKVMNGRGHADAVQQVNGLNETERSGKETMHCITGTVTPSLKYTKSAPDNFVNASTTKQPASKE